MFVLNSEMIIILLAGTYPLSSDASYLSMWTVMLLVLHTVSHAI